MDEAQAFLAKPAKRLFTHSCIKGRTWDLIHASRKENRERTSYTKELVEHIATIHEDSSKGG